MADKNKSVETNEKNVDRRFESTVKNLLNTPPKPKRGQLKKEGSKAAPKLQRKTGSER
ncbi:MAG TPA: hypothetical protein VKA31_00395 [Mariprofundaceae bacterium]|nr:hypothetical protein [Mariprofundaceae bacterium]HKJ61913.1 hypothetical protein [Hyphomicrobiales bacterium]